MTPRRDPILDRLPVDWAAVIALICVSAVAICVVVLAVAVAIDGGPVPAALQTALGVLIGLAVAYLGPRRPAE